MHYSHEPVRSPSMGGKRRGGIPMSHSRVENYIHCVYATSNRQLIIPTDLLEELWAYNIGIGRNKRIPVLAAGGIENHIHLLIELPATKSLADAINIFKSNSSRWMKTKGVKDFSWQIGYGAFSISPQQLGPMKRYIRNQRGHHKTQTYEEEFIGFLKRAGIEYDPDHVFD
jgi:putative transposase